MRTRNILIVGVGGQGTLLTSRVLGNLAVNQGHDVKLSEVHGMSQRGGSVVTHVRYGQKVYSPLVEVGEADIILAFEKMEALRWKHFLRPDGILLVNMQQINPMPVTIGQAIYPENILDVLCEEVKNFYPVDALNEARELGNSRTMNMVLVGVLAAKMDIEPEKWLEVIACTVPQKTIEINQKAFEQGYGLIRNEVTP